MYDYYGRGFVRKYPPSMGFIRRSKSVQLRLELEEYSPQSRIETYQLIAICRGYKRITDGLLLTCDYQLVVRIWLVQGGRGPKAHQKRGDADQSLTAYPFVHLITRWRNQTPYSWCSQSYHEMVKANLLLGIFRRPSTLDASFIYLWTFSVIDQILQPYNKHIDIHQPHQRLPGLYQTSGYYQKSPCLTLRSLSARTLSRPCLLPTRPLPRRTACACGGLSPKKSATRSSSSPTARPTSPSACWTNVPSSACRKKRSSTAMTKTSRSR
jgi:hypothetical protein